MGKKGKSGIGFIDGLANNIESGFRADFENLGQVFSGNFNNQFNSAMQGSATQTVFGADTKKAAGIVGAGGETAVERKKREATEKVEEGVATDLANQKAELLRQNAAVISGAVESRKRSPGKGQTLLTGAPGNSNTLLSLVGK